MVNKYNTTRLWTTINIKWCFCFVLLFEVANAYWICILFQRYEYHQVNNNSQYHGQYFSTLSSIYDFCHYLPNKWVTSFDITTAIFFSQIKSTAIFRHIESKNKVIISSETIYPVCLYANVVFANVCVYTRVVNQNPAFHYHLTQRCWFKRLKSTKWLSLSLSLSVSVPLWWTYYVQRNVHVLHKFNSHIW